VKHNLKSNPHAKRAEFQWQLPPQIEQRIGEYTYGHQRAIFEADHLLLILHAPPAPNETARQTQVFLRKPDGTFVCNGQEDGQAKLRQLLASYQQLFVKHDTAYNEVENADDLLDILESLGPIKRAATNLHDALHAAHNHVRSDSFLIAIRDEAAELSRSYELLLNDARLALDHRIARNAETQAIKAHEMAHAQHKLNVLAAITFPLMAIAALFGMHLIHGLENAPVGICWIVLILGFFVGLDTKGWVTQKAHKPRRLHESARRDERR
jgi:hypothetical protein